MPSPKERLAWPDIAKGISILGVVLLHITLAVPESQETWLFDLNVWLDPLRMPLFFLVSGYFSAKVFRFSLRELFTRRLWFFLVPYIVWVTVELWTKKLQWHWDLGTPLLGWQELLYNLFFGHTMGWFIHALIVFNLFLWAVRKLPAWAAIILSFWPIIVFAWQDQFYFIGKAMMFLPIFVGAAYLRGPITKFAAAADAPFKGQWTPLTIIAYASAVLSYLAGFLIRRAWDNNPGDVAIPWIFPGADFLDRGDAHILVRFVEQTLETPAGIVGAVLIAHIPGLSHMLRFIGRHTLPIYLGHPIGLTVGYGYIMSFTDFEISLNGAWPLENTWFWLIACFFFAGLASLVLWVIGKLPYVGWTLNPPPLGKIRRFAEPFVTGHPQPGDDKPTKGAD
ncbi:Putative membrane protein [Corynebacterium camporealensis]|uniref:Putative membrane protein n=1 Tax=Corynebacterium camporealensis TaxID=161896 RepID=A0A0F6QWQ4_9CORY|nr:acyltransferase family protein [Corynebacterium camporealensis]AKE39537.1 putative membrane protein [Corynebacterium camporealensis]AVH88684.1 Putative membrane protein [Corynebacterium camporealensis]